MCDSLMDNFQETIETYLIHGNNSDFEVHLSKAKKMEHNADSLLHTIENFLYEKSLLPESREDILRLFEKFDDIVDSSVHILRYLNTRNITIPSNIHDDVTEIIKVSRKAYEEVKQAINELFYKRKNLLSYVRTINDYESICDDIQAKIITTIFRSDIDKYDKILLSDVITIMAKLTDHCEDSADVIALINVKRAI